MDKGFEKGGNTRGTRAVKPLHRVVYFTAKGQGLRTFFSIHNEGQKSKIAHITIIKMIKPCSKIATIL